MIGILNYGSGNITSLSNSLNEISIKHSLINNPKELKNIEKLIIPGVGSYYDAIKKIKKKNFFYEIKKFAEKKPILGICVGMQILSEQGFENKKTEGLALIDGVVDKIYKKHKESHVGWNNLKIIKKKSILFNEIEKESDFYFVHSYSFQTKYKSNISSNIYFNNKQFVASIEKDHIFGVQFHPEKSHKNGLKLLNNFCSL
ncbi:imidazole glycerol phosphate synthase subunit HisH [Candidatus Pelagibacter sp.]|uniref:imidazole glycerol phosphate synthase subunit HisH n=1 Tax=Candidatus Pelagibacter sp. TaxID=2024849 RepID=UPI003F86995D